MKLNKKQTAALNRIIDRETNREIIKMGGVHTSRSKRHWDSKANEFADDYVVTDGSILVIFKDRPDDLPEAERNDFLCEYEYKLCEDDRSVLSSVSPTASECKQAIRTWKRKIDYSNPKPPKVQVAAADENGGQLVGYYDARLLLDALEIMGAGAMVYIGKDGNHRLPYPYVTVYRSVRYGSSREVDFDSMKAVILPCHPD